MSETSNVKVYLYGDGAFKNTSKLLPEITRVSALLGLRPQAIYGALVEENDAFLNNRVLNGIGDALANSTIARIAPSWLTQIAWKQAYQKALQEEKIDRHSTLDKRSSLPMAPVGMP